MFGDDTICGYQLLLSSSNAIHSYPPVLVPENPLECIDYVRGTIQRIFNTLEPNVIGASHLYRNTVKWGYAHSKYESHSIEIDMFKFFLVFFFLFHSIQRKASIMTGKSFFFMCGGYNFLVQNDANEKFWSVRMEILF